MAFGSVGSATIDLSLDAKKAVAGLDSIRKKTAATTREMAADFDRVKKNFDGIANVGKKAFLAIGAAMTAVIYTASKFETQMASVSTMLSGLDNDLLPSLSKGILDMSVEFGEGTATLSKGLYDILSASIPASESLDVLAVAAEAATAGMTDTGVAADVITSILNAYGMEASKAADVSDILFTTVKAGKTTFSELAASVGPVIAVAAGAGVAFDEVAAVLSTVTRNGIRTDIAVTGLRAALAELRSPTKDAKAAAEELGFVLDENTVREIGLIGIIEKMIGATEQQIDAMFKNQRSFTTLSSAIKNGTGVLEDFAKQQERTGATTEAFDKIATKFEFQIKQLKEAFTVLLVAIGELFTASKDGQSIIESLKNTFVDLSKSIESLSPSMKKWVVGLSAGALGVSALMIAIGKLGPALVIGAKGMWSVIAATGKFVLGLGSLNVALVAVGAAWLAHEHYFNKAKAATDNATVSLQKNISAIREQQALLEGYGRIIEQGSDGTNILQIFDKLAPKIAEAGAEMAGLREQVIKSDGSIYGLRDAVNKALEDTDNYAVILNGEFRIFKATIDEAKDSTDEFGMSAIDALKKSMELLQENSALAKELGFSINGAGMSMDELTAAAEATTMAMQKAWADGDYNEFLALLQDRIALEEQIKKNAEDTAAAWKEAMEEATNSTTAFYEDLRENSGWSTQAVINDIEERMAALRAAGKEESALYVTLGQKLVVEQKKANAAYVQIWDNTVASINRGMSDMISDIIKGNKDIEESFKDLGRVIVDSFIDAFAQSIVKKLGFDKLFTSNIFGLADMFESTIGGLFSGAATEAATATGAIGAGATGSATIITGGTTTVIAGGGGVTATGGIGAGATGAAVATGGAVAPGIGAGAALSVASLGLGAAVLGLGVGVAYLTGAFDEASTRYDEWFSALQDIEYVGDQNAQNAISTLDQMVNTTNDFDFVLKEDISKRNLWYKHYVESTKAFSDAQLEQAKDILGIYDSAAEKAEMINEGFDFSQDADNWRSQSQEIIDSIAAAGTSAEQFAIDTQDAINYWMGHEQRDQMPLEGVLSEIAGMTDQFSTSLANEIQLMDDWAIHQFALNDEFINELIAGAEQTTKGISVGSAATGAEEPFKLGQLMEVNAALGDFSRRINAADDEMDKFGSGLDSDFSELTDKFGDFGWSEYLENIDWDTFIQGVDLSEYVKTEADTFGQYARGTKNFPGGIGLVGERGPELVTLPRGSKISPYGSFGGITLGYGAIRINTGPINTVADEAQLEARLTKSISRAIESAVTR